MDGQIREPGVVCPECKKTVSKVVHARRRVYGRIDRERLCENCGLIFETAEFTKAGTTARKYKKREKQNADS